MQTQLNFTTHIRENNSRSEAHLKAHKEHFSKQCTLLYNILKSGRKLTVFEAYSEGIASLPRRVKDLREGGIKIDSETVPGTKFIRYFIQQP